MVTWGGPVSSARALVQILLQGNVREYSGGDKAAEKCPHVLINVAVASARLRGELEAAAAAGQPWIPLGVLPTCPEFRSWAKAEGSDV